MKNKTGYLKMLEEQYIKKFPASRRCFENGREYFPNMVSHAGRFLSPFPPYIKSARGSIIETVEGEKLVDFWQGHFCNILGHNPTIITEAIKGLFENGLGLQLGIYTKLETELASLLKRVTGLEQFVFTTSGTLATMYSVMLGLANTKRYKVLKIAGGWHGAHPWSLKGVKFPNGLDKVVMESAGISDVLAADTIITPFNDCEALEQCFKEHGNELGVFILELVLGNSGMVVADKAFIKKSRELATKYGVILAIDEMVTGFRVRPGGMYKLYDIEPDIVMFGKAITGGMPFACIAGRKEVLSCVSTSQPTRVWADSGTFTSHPATLVAVITMVKYLADNADKIYPKILGNMDFVRGELKNIFEKSDIAVHITGESHDEGIPNFPIGTIRYIKDEKLYNCNNALKHWDPEAVDITLRDKISKMSLMTKGFYTWQGLGVMTNAHTDDQIKNFLLAYKKFVQEIKEINKD
jgi:glutamate-1-semialdehyde 2,1-aminomutase